MMRCRNFCPANRRGRLPQESISHFAGCHLICHTMFAGIRGYISRLYKAHKPMLKAKVMNKSRISARCVPAQHMIKMRHIKLQLLRLLQLQQDIGQSQ